MKAKIVKKKLKRAGGAGAGGPAVAAAAPPPYEETMKKAQELVDQLDLEAAAEMYEDLLAYYPQDVKLLDTFAEVAFQLGDKEGAFDALKRSVTIEPVGHHSKWMLLGQLLEGKPAAEAFTQGIQLLEGEVQKAATLAADPSATPEQVAAVKVLRRQLSTALSSLAELYMTDLCDEDAAEGLCEQYSTMAVGADESNPEALHTLANLRLCQKRPADAIPLLSACVKKIEDLYDDEDDGGDEDEDDEELGGGVAASSGGSAASAAAVAEAKPSSPTDSALPLPSYQSRLQIARVCMEVEAYQDALVLLDRLLAEDDSQMEVWYLTGEAHHLAGEHADAVERLATAEGMLTAALQRAKAAKGKNAPPLLSSDTLASVGVAGLTSQLGMIRKLKAVAEAALAAAPAPAAAAAPAMADE